MHLAASVRVLATYFLVMRLRQFGRDRKEGVRKKKSRRGIWNAARKLARYKNYRFRGGVIRFLEISFRQITRNQYQISDHCVAVQQPTLLHQNW